MINSKLVFTAAALAVITLAAPAFAQSVDHTGTLQPSFYDRNGKQVMGSRSPQTVVQVPQSRPLYNSVAAPVGPGTVSGYDPSIASQH